MATIAAISLGESGTNPKNAAHGRYGMVKVSASSATVDQSSSVPGRLRKKGRCVRITVAATSSVNSDSTNQPVRNVAVISKDIDQLDISTIHLPPSPADSRSMSAHVPTSALLSYTTSNRATDGRSTATAQR